MSGPFPCFGLFDETVTAHAAVAKSCFVGAWTVGLLLHAAHACVLNVQIRRIAVWFVCAKTEAPRLGDCALVAPQLQLARSNPQAYFKT